MADFLLTPFMAGFFPGGTGYPQAAKILPIPLPTDRHPCFLTRACPQTELCPKKFYLIFLSILTTFLAQNCAHQKALHVFYALNTKICPNLAAGGSFGPSVQFYQVPPHLTLFRRVSLPSDTVPNRDRKSSTKASFHHQKFCEKKP